MLTNDDLSTKPGCLFQEDTMIVVPVDDTITKSQPLDFHIEKKVSKHSHIQGMPNAASHPGLSGLSHKTDPSL
jgi:hypothetical protein